MAADDTCCEFCCVCANEFSFSDEPNDEEWLTIISICKIKCILNILMVIIKHMDSSLSASNSPCTCPTSRPVANELNLLINLTVTQHSQYYKDIQVWFNFPLGRQVSSSGKRGTK
jgi:hypothetical protein